MGGGALVIKKLRHENGLTLIEVLAAMVIGTIIALLLINALSFGLQQYKNQSIKSRELTDVTYVAKVITKEIRKATEVAVNDEDAILKLVIDNNVVKYQLDDERDILIKNDEELYFGISLFDVTKNNGKIKLIIESSAEAGRVENIETEIYLRR